MFTWFKLTVKLGILLFFGKKNTLTCPKCAEAPGGQAGIAASWKNMLKAVCKDEKIYQITIIKPTLIYSYGYESWETIWD